MPPHLKNTNKICKWFDPCPLWSLWLNWVALNFRDVFENDFRFTRLWNDSNLKTFYYRWLMRLYSRITTNLAFAIIPWFPPLQTTSRGWRGWLIHEYHSIQTLNRYKAKTELTTESIGEASFKKYIAPDVFRHLVTREFYARGTIHW